MEDDFIDIAEILKSYPKGTKLYSPICGECELDCLCYGDNVITVVYKGRVTSNYTPSELYDELDRNYILCFDKYGRYKTTDKSETNGEVMLFPSKNCRDWDAMRVTQRFKKGDFVTNRGFICIYNGINKNGAIQYFAFIPWDWDRNTSIERYYIEPTEKYKIGVGYIDNETRLATEFEKNLLLSAIEYKGYVWDAEKLELRKNEPEFKPFDKVLVRDVISGVWMLAQYAFEDKGTEYKYNTVGGEYWQYCIPYEGNEHLLGTTENCK